MRTIAVDTETFLIFDGVKAPPLVCMSHAERVGGSIERGVVKHDDPALFSTIHAWFEDRDVHTTFANAPFDLAVFMAWDRRLVGPILQALEDGRIHDVQTREKLIDLGEGKFRFEEDEETGEVFVKSYSLGAIGVRRFDKGKEFDQWRLRYHDLWDVPLEKWPREALYYAMADADLTLRIHEAQEGGVNLHDEAAQVRGHFALHMASCYGLRTDENGLDLLETRVRQELDRVTPSLVDAGLVRADGTRDTKAAIRRMIDKSEDPTLTSAGVELLRGEIDEKAAAQLTKTEQGTNFIESRDVGDLLLHAMQVGKYVSVNEDACNASGDAVLRDYSTYTRYRNLLTGSIKHLRRGTVLPIQTNFSPLMETGRTSSSSPNVQNLRRAPGIRECFVPRAGNYFVAADYSAAELHTLAQACLDLFGESNLAVALNEGIDPHLWVGALILGVDYEQAVALKKTGDVTMKNARQLAKAANFGFPGGCSARRFTTIAAGYTDADGQPLELDEYESQRLRATWFRAWPEMREYFDHVSASVDASGWHYVEQPRTKRLRKRCTYTSACNSAFQGLCADGAKRALWAVTREQFRPGTALCGTAIVNFVHDEIILEAPYEAASAAALRLEKVMAEEFNALCPDVPVHAEAVVMRYWSKDAERIVEDGELKPWPKVS